MSRISKSKITIIIVLAVVLCMGLIAGLTLGKYVQEWEQGFGLIISPLLKDEIEDPADRYYFRSNELLAQSENAAYTVNGTSTWFSVANALDTNTYSKIDVSYTLTWSVSADGSNWIQYKTESNTFEADRYLVEKYTVEPVTLNGTLYNTVKVEASTGSFKQEVLSAVYTFIYSDPSVEISYASGIITVTLDTNDVAGDFTFAWNAGITPDNSDPNLIFTSASDGPAELTAALRKNTGYTFVFFVTDADVLEKLDDSLISAADMVSVTAPEE